MIVGTFFYQCVNNIAFVTNYFSGADPDIVKSIEKTIFNHSNKLTWPSFYGP